jgi:hypothetical protein
MFNTPCLDWAFMPRVSDLRPAFRVFHVLITDGGSAELDS